MVTVFGPTAGVRIATAYGLGTQARLVGPVAHGRRGEVWQLTTATGRYAVKVSFQPPSGPSRPSATRPSRTTSGGPAYPCLRSCAPSTAR